VTRSDCNAHSESGYRNDCEGTNSKRVQHLQQQKVYFTFPFRPSTWEPVNIGSAGVIGYHEDFHVGIMQNTSYPGTGTTHDLAFP
jgi:hypothetical protein